MEILNLQVVVQFNQAQFLRGRMEENKVTYLFSGIGAFEKALTNLQIDFEIVNYCEIDKYASAAYSIHTIPESKNLGDIAKIDIEQYSLIST